MSDENVSMDQLIAALKDPEKLRVVMAATGMVPAGVSKPTEKPAKRTIPTLDLPEDADMPTLVQGLNKFFYAILIIIIKRTFMTGENNYDSL